MAGIEEVVGKALSDELFCAQLIAEPEVVLRDHGVEPDDELIETIRGLDLEAVRRLAAAFGSDQAAG